MGEYDKGVDTEKMKTLKINSFSGRFGNQILYYFALRKTSYNLNLNYSCPEWQGVNIFKGNIRGKETETNFVYFPLELGENFFENYNISTREVFQLKNKPFIQNGSVAIHFRGGDFHQWNPDSILSTEYYLNSINQIYDAKRYYLFTDDTSLKSYIEVKDCLKNKECFFSGDFIDDFSKMSECDYIISSPSTFCICAGFIGKQKKIIHSKDWVENRANKNDKFWVDLLNGGNYDYSIWRLL